MATRATARRPLIVGNWKMNGLRAEARALALDLARRLRAATAPGFDMMLCPPFPLLADVAEAVRGSGLGLGAQDCHAKPAGAFTGDVAAALLKDLGCSAVIVGHSERRTLHGETDAVVKAKAEAALAAGLTAIVCIGETEAERDSGRTLEVVASQIDGSLPHAASATSLVLAYEPVWAIGTGRTPTPDDVQQVHAAARTRLAGRLAGGATESVKVRILYGGSVNAANASRLLGLDDVDGGLVGGASLKADDFWTIAQSCP